jgi:hypothetical protein
MKSIFQKILLTSLLLAGPGLTFKAAAAVAMGMGMGMGMGPPCGGPFPPCPVPLDSGVAILFLAGAAYGGKKIYDSIKKDPA